MDDDGHPELLVGTEDFEIRALKSEVRRTGSCVGRVARKPKEVGGGDEDEKESRARFERNIER